MAKAHVSLGTLATKGPLDTGLDLEKAANVSGAEVDMTGTSQLVGSLEATADGQIWTVMLEAAAYVKFGPGTPTADANGRKLPAGLFSFEAKKGEKPAVKAA